MPGNRTVAAVDTAIEICNYLDEHERAGVTELAESVGIAPSTAHHHLHTLVENEVVIKEGNRYSLSSWFLRLGTAIKYRSPEYRLARTYVDRIESETGFRTVFVVEEHGYGVFLHTRTGDRSAWNHAREGERSRLHLTAAGKAILAHLPESRLYEIIERHGLEGGTDRAITEIDDLEEELREIRETDVAINDGENIEGILAIGTPVIGQQDRLIGAISISGAANRFHDEELKDELTGKLLAAVNEFELELTLSESAPESSV